MGLLDRWRKRADPASSSLVAPGVEAQTTVPPGHKVELHRMASSPSILSLAGGVWLAQLGGNSDDTEAELDAVLAGVGEWMRGPRPRVVLNAAAGSLSALMAPGNPEVTLHDGILVWTIDVASLARASGASALVQRWLGCLDAIGTGSPLLMQSVFLHEVVSRPARAVATRVRALGIDVRVPDTGETAILAEVHRPDGIILSALLGASPDADRPSNAPARRTTDLAEAEQDAARKQRLEVEEREALDRELAPVDGEPRVPAVWRAPRLRRLLLAVADDGDSARQVLYEELLRREIPLHVIVDPQTQGARLCTWPGGVEALPVYADEVSLLASARDHGMKLGTFAGAAMPPPQLFAWAASNSWALAMNAFRAPDEPVYVVLTEDEVKALAQGRMPSSLPERSSGPAWS